MLTGSIVLTPRSKLYTADLESGLHCLLRVELAAHRALAGAELRTLKDFITVVAKVCGVFSGPGCCFPGPGCMCLPVSCVCLTLLEPQDTAHMGGPGWGVGQRAALSRGWSEEHLPRSEMSVVAVERHVRRCVAQAPSPVTRGVGEQGAGGQLPQGVCRHNCHPRPPSPVVGGACCGGQELCVGPAGPPFQWEVELWGLVGYPSVVPARSS